MGRPMPSFPRPWWWWAILWAPRHSSFLYNFSPFSAVGPCVWWGVLCRVLSDPGDDGPAGGHRVIVHFLYNFSPFVVVGSRVWWGVQRRGFQDPGHDGPAGGRRVLVHFLYNNFFTICCSGTLSVTGPPMPISPRPRWWWASWWAPRHSSFFVLFSPFVAVGPCVWWGFLCRVFPDPGDDGPAGGCRAIVHFCVACKV